jgi:hypothetical protein
MEGKMWGYSSNEDSDDEVYLQNASDEEDIHSTSSSLPKLQFRFSILLHYALFGRTNLSYKCLSYKLFISIATDILKSKCFYIRYRLFL